MELNFDEKARNLTAEDITNEFNRDIREELMEMGVDIETATYADFIAAVAVSSMTEIVGEVFMRRPLSSFNSIGELMDPYDNVIKSEWGANVIEQIEQIGKLD